MPLKFPNQIGIELGGSLVGTRPRLNFIQGSNVTLTVTDDPTNNEVDVTIASSGGSGFAWSAAPSSATAAVNTGYITTGASLVTLTLPSTAALGATIRVAGQAAGGWKVGIPSGVTVQTGTVDLHASGGAGYFQSTDRYDAIELLCVVANTTWTVISARGNITVA